MENGIPSREELLRNRDGRNPANVDIYGNRKEAGSFPAERPAVKKRIEEIKKKYKGTIGAEPGEVFDGEHAQTQEEAAKAIHAEQNRVEPPWSPIDEE